MGAVEDASSKIDAFSANLGIGVNRGFDNKAIFSGVNAKEFGIGLGNLKKAVNQLTDEERKQLKRTGIRIIKGMEGSLYNSATYSLWV